MILGWFQSLRIEAEQAGGPVFFSSENGGDQPPHLAQNGSEWGGMEIPKIDQNDQKVPLNPLFFSARRRRRRKIVFFDVFERFPHLKTQKTFKKDGFLSLGDPPQMGGTEFFLSEMGGIVPPIPPIWGGNINTARDSSVF